jgi:hypothetical protein
MIKIHDCGQKLVYQVTCKGKIITYLLGEKEITKCPKCGGSLI